MQPPRLKPDGNSLTERPVVNAISQNTQTRAADLSDAERLRAELLNDTDLEYKSVRSLAQCDVLWTDTENDILVHILKFARKFDLQLTAFEYAA